MNSERPAGASAASSASEQPSVSPPSTIDRTAFRVERSTAGRKDDGYVTPPLRERERDAGKPGALSAATGAVETAALSYSPVTSGANKRKRADITSSAISEAAETAATLIAASNVQGCPMNTQQHVVDGNAAITGRSLDIGTQSAKRKSSSDFLRKGQWTTTEERLARLLIEAFEEGYLPIYTGIRLRGYLAVQLQCDPMRVSKKLCAGTVDGKRVPKNYGQKKFKLRKKVNWDRDEAGRILATLEKLTDEMWRESAVARPPFLTLSSTRNADEEEPSVPRDAGASPASPVRRLSPSVSKKHKSVVFPIIYLNLSKKHKQHLNVSASHNSSSSEADPVGDSTPSMSEDDELDSAKKKRKTHKAGGHPAGKLKPVDGESLQAAYDLLTLCQPSQPGSASEGKKRAAAKAVAGAPSLPPAVAASAP